MVIRVALIEDNLTDAARVRGVLEKPAGQTHFQLEHFTTLKRALERLQSAQFDILLLDLSLPGISGARALSKVIAAAPQLPIIVLAGTNVPHGLLEGIRNDGRNYLSKSRMSGEELIEAIMRETSGTEPAGDRAIHRSSEAIRVLVVDDDHGDLAATRSLLAAVKAVHFEVLHAPTLSSALTLLQAGADIVLIDLRLPDCQGLATLHQMRAQDPKVPIIVLARPEDRSMALEALSQGARNYMVKGQVDSYLLGQLIIRCLAPQSRGKSAG